MAGHNHLVRRQPARNPVRGRECCSAKHKSGVSTRVSDANFSKRRPPSDSFRQTATPPPAQPKDRLSKKGKPFSRANTSISGFAGHRPAAGNADAQRRALSSVPCLLSAYQQPAGSARENFSNEAKTTPPVPAFQRPAREKPQWDRRLAPKNSAATRQRSFQPAATMPRRAGNPGATGKNGRESAWLPDNCPRNRHSDFEPRILSACGKRAPRTMIPIRQSVFWAGWTWFWFLLK